MNRCQWCGRVPSGFGMVVLTIKEDEPSQSICRDCYNEFAANMLGIEDYKDFEKEAIFTDCDGIEHRFQVGKMINPFPKGKIIYCIAFFLILCTAGVMMASVSGFSIESIFSTSKSKGYNDAIFERNGEICWFDYSEGSITILDRGGKYTPVLSPNRSRILYRKSVFETEGNVMQFGIITIDGEFLREIVIDSYLSNDIIGLQWLSDSTVGITTHVNPSTSEFFVYNVDTGEKIASYVGYAFAQIPNTDKIIHAENVPHWSDEPVYHSFVVDGKIVYTSDIIDARWIHQSSPAMERNLHLSKICRT